MTRSLVVPREDNKLRPEDRAVHEWYRFVLSFPPHLVRSYINSFELEKGSVILDPFCGTGTTVVECKKLGLNGIGIEANPMPLFASQVKVDWTPKAVGLLEHAERIAAAAQRALVKDGLGPYDELPLFSTQSKNGGHNGLRTISVEREKLLLKDSISAIPLHKTLTLLAAIEQHKDAAFSGHERVALAKTIVFGASNLHFGPEVGVGAPKENAAVVEHWLGEMKQIAGDLRHFGGNRVGTATVDNGDARDLLDTLPDSSISAVITSPPYPNEKDYTRTTRLESVLLGFIRDRAHLRALKQSLVRSNTRNVYKHDRDDEHVANCSEVERIATEIERRRIELGKTSGWERMYARVTRHYFGGMTRHLASLRPKLRPGARLAYVVGDQASYFRVLIPTGRILAEIAESLGYEVTSIDLFRTRRSTATKEHLREEVVVLRWPERSRSG